MSPHDSLAVHPDPSERSPTLPSSSGLCVRQIENEQQSTVGEVTAPWPSAAVIPGITAAEGHGASTSTGWPRQRCTKSPRLRQLAEWKETNKKNKIAGRCGAPRPPMTDVGTAKLLSDWTSANSASISEKVNISWGQRSIDAIKPIELHLRRSTSTGE